MRLVLPVLLLTVLLASAVMAQNASVERLYADIVKIEARYSGDFTALYNKCKSQNIPLDYPNIARETLDQFIPYAKADIKLGLFDRARLMVRELNIVLDESTNWMDYYLKYPKLVPSVRRYHLSKVRIDGTSFVADRVDTNGKKDRGPVFFVGYGHFDQVYRDMPRWENYGINMVQIEIGPDMIMPDADHVSLDAVYNVIKVLDEAARHNVMVNIQFSPHYFPRWAYQKWPHIEGGGGGNLAYSIDTAEAKALLDKFHSIVVPMIKDHPALHSLCVSGEPSFERSALCRNTRELWDAYLARVHGDIKTLNERYGTNYASFADVPYATFNGFSEPQYYDYTMFATERLANWHKFLADSVHKYAPNIPLQVKWRAGEIWNRQTMDLAVDPELYKDFEINGNDCYFLYDGGEYACNWHVQDQSYDLQRSLAPKPIFNSENHPTYDARFEKLAPEHFQACLWEGAVRGQSATTMWVWDRTEDPKYFFYGNVIDRPACAAMTGRTCLDLNRFAEEVTALQHVKSPVAILYTQVSESKNDNYLQAADRAYESLIFSGVKIDWITEKQLQEGKGNQYKMIILPDASHVFPQTVDAIEKLSKSVKLVWIGDSLAKDPYGKAYPHERLTKLKASAIKFGATDDPKTMWPVIRGELERLGALPKVRVVDAVTGVPVWGVEYLPAKVNGRSIVYIINLSRKVQQVKVLRDGREAPARDLMSMGSLQRVDKLKPMVPVVAEL